MTIHLDFEEKEIKDLLERIEKGNVKASDAYKDLMLFQSKNRLGGGHYAMINKTKPKILKDIIPTAPGDAVSNIVVGMLKDEAIKHIKKLSKPIREPTHGPCCTCQKCGMSHDECVCLEREATIDWIKHFFGIEEEDFFTEEQLKNREILEKEAAKLIRCYQPVTIIEKRDLK